MKVEDQYPYDILMANTAPALVGFQIDVGNLTFGGADAISFLKKYPTRYSAMHVRDFKPGKASGPVGSGDLDWNTILDLAMKANIKTYIAEVARMVRRPSVVLRSSPVISASSNLSGAALLS